MNKGYFLVSDELYTKWYEMFHLIFKDFRPIKIKRQDDDIWYFYGLSDKFDEIGEDVMPPQYEVEFIWDQGHITYKFKRVTIIKDMNLLELADALEDNFFEAEPYANRLRQLHAEHEAIKKQNQYISVTERIPTMEDGDTGDITGCVIAWVVMGHLPRVVNWKTVADNPMYSHWNRITPPKSKS